MHPEGSHTDERACVTPERRQKSILQVATVAVTIRAFLLPLGRYFQERGYRCGALANGVSRWPELQTAFDDVAEIDWSRSPWRFWKLLKASGRVREVVDRGRYDLVHVHTPVAAFMTRFALRRLRKEGRIIVVYTAHGFHFYRGGPPIRNLIYVMLERLAGSWTDHVIVINREDEAAATRFRIVPPERLHYMPGIGVDLDEYNPDTVPTEDLAHVRSELDLGRHDVLFLMVADLISRKRPEDAVHALARLGRPEAHLAIAGIGPCEEALRHRVKALGLQNRVHLLGFRNDISRLARSSRAVILASRQEGLPRSVMESLALEVPVIGTDIRGVRDLIEGGRGLLYPVGDIDGLARLMAWVLDHPVQAGMLGRAGRISMRNHTLARVLSLHESLYTDVMNRRQRTRCLAASDEGGAQISARYRSGTHRGGPCAGASGSVRVAEVTTADISLRFLLLDLLDSIKTAGYGVVAVSAPGPHAGDVVAAGIRHIPVPMTRRVTPFADLLALWKLVRVFRREQVSVVHTHTPKANLLGQLAAWIAGVPVRVITIHGFLTTPETPVFKRLAFQLIERISAAPAHAVFLLNREDMTTAWNLNMGGPGQLRYFRPGIDLARFSRTAVNQHAVEKVRVDLAFPPHARIVGYVGRLVAEKGVDDLVNAARRVKDQRPDVRFLFIGPTDSEKADALTAAVAAEDGLADICRFTGMRYDLPELYSLMDVLVLPSHREGFPRVLMEAAAMGVPCVVTDIRGSREIVDHEGNGLRVPLKDADAIATAILSILADPERSARMSAEGERMARERFDQNQGFDEVLRAFAELLRGRGIPYPTAAPDRFQESARLNTIDHSSRYART